MNLTTTSRKSIGVFVFAVLASVNGRAEGADHAPAPSLSADASPCPSCPVATPELAAFRHKVGSEILPVLVELRERSGLSMKAEAEQTGNAMPTERLMAHASGLLERQKSFLDSLQGRGVRALLREHDAAQIDGSVRHVRYQLSYLMNGFVEDVAHDDLATLRALPEVRHVYEIHPAQFYLNTAIDYSLGTNAALAARRAAVYGNTLEFKPPGTLGHPEAPELNRVDGFEGQGMIIALIDSGVDWRHPMFGGTGLNSPPPHIAGQPASSTDNQKIIYYYSLSSPGNPTDDFGHGTLVSSCMAGYLVDGNTPANPGYGTGQNGSGIGPTPGGVPLHGMAPQARIMAYKVCGPADSCAGDIDLAIEDAASPYTLAGSTTGGTVTNTFIPKPVADVINLSLGNSSGDPSDSTAVMANNAALAGVIVVTAAGNSGPAPNTLGSPAIATLAIAVAASLDPGSLGAADVLAAGQIPGETRTPGSAGPAPVTGAASQADLAQAGARQNISLYPAAGGGPVTNGSVSANYVFVDRRNNANPIPPEARNRIALVEGSGTFAQLANAVAPEEPAAILIVTSVQNATAVAVVNGIPTFTIGTDDGNYLLSIMVSGVGPESVTNGTISELPLRVERPLALANFEPGMAGFSSRGPDGQVNARFRVVKPDVTAPGVGILGAATPTGLPDSTIGLADPSGYTTADGTSFATPITSGTMALIRQHVRLDLSLDSTNLTDPHYRSKRFDALTVARALLMNSASNLRSGLGVPEADGTNSSASINDFGAGHINVARALQAHAVMFAPTLLLSSLPEFVAPTNDPPSPSDFDAAGNLRVLIPSASFGPVPIVGVNGSISSTQQVMLRDVSSGLGAGTYNLAIENNRNADQPGFQVALYSVDGHTNISSISLSSGAQTAFEVVVTANGNLISADPTEFQWFVSATHSASGQSMRMPFYYRAVAPAIPNIVAPVQQAVLADYPPATNGDCSLDNDSRYSVRWTYTVPSGGPAPVGFRIQESTRSSVLFFDDASSPLVANANANWSGGMDWVSTANPNNSKLAYYVPDTSMQNSSLAMVNSVSVPAGGATFSFLDNHDFEDGFDYGYVEISTDGGSSFTQVATYGYDFIGTQVVDISPFSGHSIKMRFRFVSDTLNGPPDPAPTGWFIQNISITSDDFHTIGSVGPDATSFEIRNRPNGTYTYRVAGLFATPLGLAPGPYSATQCATENIIVPIIASIRPLTSQHILLGCLGPAGTTFRIQGATDLQTWVTLGSQTASSNGTFTFEDTTAPAYPARFYRLIAP